MHTLLLLALISSAPSQTATRALSLAEAVELALRAEPLLAEARIVRERAELAVLRARLDRVSAKVDAELQEIWNASGLGRAERSSAGIGLSNASAGLNVPVFSGAGLPALDLAADLVDGARAGGGEGFAVVFVGMGITARETEIMDLVVAGKTNKETATELGVSPRTVEVHRSRLMTKLGMDSVATLVRLRLRAIAASRPT